MNHGYCEPYILFESQKMKKHWRNNFIDLLKVYVATKPTQTFTSLIINYSLPPIMKFTIRRLRMWKKYPENFSQCEEVPGDMASNFTVAANLDLDL